MTHPMSLASRVRRVAAGTALILLALLGIGTPWTWAGSVPLMAGAIGWCPFQALGTALVKRGGAGFGLIRVLRWARPSQRT